MGSRLLARPFNRLRREGASLHLFSSRTLGLMFSMQDGPTSLFSKVASGRFACSSRGEPPMRQSPFQLIFVIYLAKFVRK